MPERVPNELEFLVGDAFSWRDKKPSDQKDWKACVQLDQMYFGAVEHFFSIIVEAVRDS